MTGIHFGPVSASDTTQLLVMRELLNNLREHVAAHGARVEGAIPSSPVLGVAPDNSTDTANAEWRAFLGQKIDRRG